MVATTAFSTGNDYPHVCLVIYLDRPFNMVEFVQDQGRAGCNGRPALCYVLVPEQIHKPVGAATSLQNHNRMAIYDHLYTHRLTQCLRYGITSFMDGVGVHCYAPIMKWQPCQACENNHQFTSPITPPPSHPSIAMLPVPGTIRSHNSLTDKPNAFVIAAQQTTQTIVRKEHTIMHRAEMI